MLSISDVMTFGAIVFYDDAMGVLIVVGGDSLNWFVRQNDKQYKLIDRRKYDGTLYSISVAKAMDMAYAWFKEELDLPIEKDQ